MPVILARKGKVTGERSLSFILGNMLSAGGLCCQASMLAMSQPAVAQLRHPPNGTRHLFSPSLAVMISAGFCHLLGDAIQQLTQSIKYPLAPFLCACGFMATLIADQVVEGATEQHRQPIPVLVSSTHGSNLSKVIWLLVPSAILTWLQERGDAARNDVAGCRLAHHHRLPSRLN